MFERFTDRARRVVILAQEETRLLGHNYIGTEHFLLGLIHEAEGVAGRVLLREFGVTLDDTRLAVERATEQGTATAHGHIPFNPPARTLCEGALRQALNLGHGYIGTEHLLLSLLHTDAIGREILADFADLEQVRDRVLVMLDRFEPVKPKDFASADAINDRRHWRPEDGDTRCQECGFPYHPWFTDNWLWNTVMGGTEHTGDPGGSLCPRCFADRAAKQHPNLVWRFIPEWSGRAPLMDFKETE